MLSADNLENSFARDVRLDLDSKVCEGGYEQTKVGKPVGKKIRAITHLLLLLSCCS